MSLRDAESYTYYREGDSCLYSMHQLHAGGRSRSLLPGTFLKTWGFFSKNVLGETKIRRESGGASVGGVSPLSS